MHESSTQGHTSPDSKFQRLPILDTALETAKTIVDFTKVSLAILAVADAPGPLFAYKKGKGGRHRKSTKRGKHALDEEINSKHLLYYSNNRRR